MTAASPDELGAVRALLDRVGLPSADLGRASADVRTVELAGATVGCVAVERHGAFGLLRSLAVAPEARGRGLGPKLVEAAERVAADRQLAAVYLLTTTAAPFFEALGYAHVERDRVPEAVRRSSEFAGVCPASATVMAKQLG